VGFSNDGNMKAPWNLELPFGVFFVPFLNRPCFKNITQISRKIREFTAGYAGLDI
jgi:hypothetical protein